MQLTFFKESNTQKIYIHSIKFNVYIQCNIFYINVEIKRNENSCLKRNLLDLKAKHIIHSSRLGIFCDNFALILLRFPFEFFFMLTQISKSTPFFLNMS